MQMEDIIDIIHQQELKYWNKFEENRQYGNKAEADRAFGAYLAASEIKKLIEETAEKQNNK